MARKRRGFGRLRQLPLQPLANSTSARHAKATQGASHLRQQARRRGWLAAERPDRPRHLGAVERSDGITLRGYAERWMEQRQLRPRTRKHYASMLKRLILPDLGDIRLVQLTRPRAEWHAGLGADHPTRNAHAYALLHAICAAAVADEVLDANPCRIRAAMQTNTKRDVDVLTPAQVDALAAAMPAELSASVVLAAWCGLRWGETSGFAART